MSKKELLKLKEGQTVFGERGKAYNYVFFSKLLNRYVCKSKEGVTRYLENLYRPSK